MTPRIKKLIIVFSVLLCALAGLTFLITYFSESKIRAIAIEQLNKLLNTEVKVSSIEFSLLKRFPKASIEFRDLEITEASSNPEKQALANVKSLFLEFNPFDLLTGKYVIDQAYLEESTIRITYFKDGSNNFDFFKSDSADLNFKISLKKVVLNNALITYNNEQNRMRFTASVGELNLSGDFESDEFDLELSTAGDMQAFSYEGFNLKNSHAFELDILLLVERPTSTYRIKNADVKMDELALVLSGTYTSLETSSEVDISFNTEKFEFNDIKYFLSPAIQNTLSDFGADGIIDLDGKITGRLDARNNPLISLNYLLDNGSINHGKSNVKFNKVNFSGSFTNGSAHNFTTSSFKVENVSFEGEQGISKGSFSIVNFNKPFLSFDLISVIDLSNLQKLINNDSLEILEGICTYNLKASSYLDSLKDLTVLDLKKIKADGRLQIQNGKFKWKGYKHAIENITAYSRFGNNLIYVDSMEYSIAGIDARIEAKLYNLLPFLFYKNEMLVAQGEMYQPDLDLNKLLDSEKNGDEMGGFFLPISNSIVLNLHLITDNFEYRKFKAEKVNCEIASKYPFLIAQNISLKAMEGEFGGWMQFDISKENEISCVSQLSLKQVNIYELFYEFEDFGQNALSAENLKGYADATIDFRALFDKNFSVKPESIEAQCHLEIKNGELIKYQPALALADYIDVEELQHIRFSKLTNDIEIKDGMVYLPEMQIKSSAIELKLSGKHSFKNEIDYHFQLWLNDFLFKKAKKSKKNEEEFGEVEMDESGRAKLYMRMYGTVDDYKVKFDRKVLRDKWKGDMEEERKELKDLFKNEFSKEKREEKQAPMKFKIEWQEFEKPESDDSVKTKAEEKQGQDFKVEKKKSITNKLGKKVEDEYEDYDPNKYD